MNVSDFDKTLYDGDSTLHFYFFCLQKQPSLVSAIPKQIALMAKAFLSRKDLTTFKEGFYSFLPHVKYLDEKLDHFWNESRSKLKEDVLSRLNKGDLVISASPEFLLAPICSELELELIASEVDPRTGKCLGSNCKGDEKVRRFKEVFPHAAVEEFYSDSKSDAPLAALAKRAYLVRKDEVYPWE